MNYGPSGAMYKREEDGIVLVYQVHAATARLLFALWPFSRLVHAWSIPIQCIGRPYILYRRRYKALGRS